MAVLPVPVRSLDIANELRPVLLHLNRQLRREVHTAGVLPGQVSLLGAIRDHPGIGVADLAAREGTSVPSVCSHIDRLEAAGLVTRLQDTTDRRRVGITATADGVRALRALRSKRTAWLASRLDGLQDSDRAAIAGALRPLAALLEHPR